ncbi:quinol oxidase subunit 2 [Sulfolobales archaeon HS-7]|nr:quinol oxidase subunit 2 [Sulfolobales archaeon HS-7]
MTNSLVEHAEVIWFIVMLVLVVGYFSWSVIEIERGSSTSYRYGLPCFSGLPKDAQDAVLAFERDPPANHTSEVIDGILVVNMTVTQPDGFHPSIIVAHTNQPVTIMITSNQVVTGFYLRLPYGVVNINSVPNITTYVYFVTPQTPGNYIWHEPEYAGWNFSYWNGTLEVVAA